MDHFVQFIEVKNLTSDLWSGFYNLCERLYSEYESKAGFLSLDRFKDVIIHESLANNYIYCYVVGEHGEMAAFGNASWPNSGANVDPHKLFEADIKVSVDKCYRKQGIGGKVLSELIMSLKSRSEISTLSFRSSSQDIHNFAKRIGALKSHEMNEDRLYMGSINWEQVEEWRNCGSNNLDGACVEILKEIPAEDLESLSFFYDNSYRSIATVSLPETSKITPESIYTRGYQLNDRGVHNRSIVVRESNGVISAMTDLIYDPTFPEVIVEQLTGVVPHQQNKGRAKWLKAEMLLYVRNNYPDVCYIATSNSSDDQAMVSINDRLGFDVHKVRTTYKLDISGVLSES